MPDAAVISVQDYRPAPAWWQRCPQWFLASAAFILLGTALIKFLSALQEVQVLGRTDPVFWFLTKRQFLAVTAIVEGIVAGLILRSNSVAATSRNLFLILALSATSLFYRLVVWWSGYTGECSCLGNAAQWLGTTPATVNLAAQVLLGYMLVGSAAILAWQRLYRPKGARVIGLAVVVVSLCRGFWAEGAVDPSNAWQITGEITTISDAASGRSGRPRGGISGKSVLTHKFSLVLDERGSWNIKLATSADNFNQVIEQGCDGTNIYGMLDGSGGTSSIQGKSVAYANSAVIYPGVIKGFGPGMRNVWWLFCSPYVLGFEGETNCLSFISPLRRNPQATIFCRQSLRDRSPRLGLENSQIFNARPSEVDARPIMTLQVSESAAIEGVNYPQITLIRSYDSSGTANVSTSTVRCDAPKRISWTRPFIPEFNGRTSVMDTRSPSVRTEYIGTNWKSETEVSQLTSARRTLTIAERPQTRPRVWFIGAVLLIAGVFVIRSLARRRKA